MTPSREKLNKPNSEAGGQAGYAPDCKSVKIGSIPIPASKFFQTVLQPSQAKGSLPVEALRKSVPTAGGVRALLGRDAALRCNRVAQHVEGRLNPYV